jgi:uncharacterized protein (DUF486 family)
MRFGWPYIAPWVLLLASNLFMTFAWYWHLKFKALPLPKVILISWLIAGLEYAIAVPANRMGSAVYSPTQLKTIQEAVTLIVFVGFSALYLGEPIRLSTMAGFVLIFTGAALVFLGRG